MAGAGDARDRDRSVPGAVLARAVAVAAAAGARRRRDRLCCVAIVAALMPLGLLRMPALREGLTPARSRQRARATARRPRSPTSSRSRRKIPIRWRCGMPMSSAHWRRRARSKPARRAPRVAWRDPYAVRALVLIACIATFFAAGGERWKRVAAAFDWQGVVLPANFRVDAWVMPPAYTGKPPLMLPGIHPGETATAQRAGRWPVRRAGQFDADRALDRQASISTSPAPAASRRRRTRCRRRPAPRSIASPSPRPARRRCAAPATI